ncbi:hypothetical protein ACTXT7_008764 [Hymenolepis weldensis]
MFTCFLVVFASAILFFASADAAVMPERLSDRLISSQRVDEALEVCEHLLGKLIRTKQVPTRAFHVCLMAYVKKLAREIDGVELIYPKSFT